MKNIIFITGITLMLLWNNLLAQPTPIFTKINYEELRLKGNSSATFKIGDSPIQVKAVLGSPTSEEDFYFEMN